MAILDPTAPEKPRAPRPVPPETPAAPETVPDPPDPASNEEPAGTLAGEPEIGPEEDEVEVVDLDEVLSEALLEPGPGLRGPAMRAAARPGRGLDLSGVDFDFEAIRGGADIFEIVDDAAGDFPARIPAARRAKVKEAATTDLAGELGLPVEVLERKAARPWSAEQALRARHLLARSGERLDALARRVAGGQADEAEEADGLAFRRQMALHAGLQVQLRGTRNDLGRVLETFDTAAGPSALHEFGGRDVTQVLARRYLAIESRAGRNAFARGAWAARTREAAFEAWINGLLDRPAGQVEKGAGTTLFTLWSVPESLLPAASAAPRAQQAGAAERIPLTEVAARLYGFGRGWGDGLRLAARTLSGARQGDPLARAAAQRPGALAAETVGATGLFGRAVDYMASAARLPRRFLLTDDELFRAVATRMESHGLAVRRMAENAGLGVDAERTRQQAVQDLLDPPADLALSVEDAARFYAATDDLGDAGPWLRGAQRFALGRIVLPFVRVPSTLLRAFAESTPVTAPLMSGLRDDFRAGGARRDLAITRVALGSGIMAALAMLAAEGRITGAGPQDARKRSALRRGGWQPYALRFEKGDLGRAILGALKTAGYPLRSGPAGVYVSLAGLEPLGPVVAVVADGVDLLKGQTEPEARDAIALAMALALTENLRDRGFFGALAGFVAALEEGPEAMSGWLVRMAETMNPDAALLRDPARDDIVSDPDAPFWLRQVEAAYRAWRDATPGLSNDLPALRNLWGQKVHIGDGDWWELFPPFYIRPETFGPVEETLLELGLPFGLPERVLDGVPLNPEQYARYLELQGKEPLIDGLGQKAAMRELIASDAFAARTKREQADAVRNLHQDYLDAAREILLIESPDLAARVMERQTLQEQAAPNLSNPQLP